MKKLHLLLMSVVVLILAACGGNGDGESEGEAEGDSEGGGDRVSELQDEGTVNVGFSNEPPYAFENSETGELEGVSIDIATAVFEEMGVENIEGHLTDWGELIPGVQAGQYDVITAGMAVLPDRCENAIFSEPEMQYGEGLVVQAGNPEDIHSYADIADNSDVTLALMEGTTQFDFVEQEGVSSDQIMSVADIPGQLSAVQSGNADVAAATEATIRSAYESFDSEDVELVEDFEQPDVEGIPSFGAAAFNGEDEELKDAYNEALETLKEDGTIDEILDSSEGFTAENNRVEVGEVETSQLCEG